MRVMLNFKGYYECHISIIQGMRCYLLVKIAAVLWLAAPSVILAPSNQDTTGMIYLAMNTDLKHNPVGKYSTLF